MADRCGIAGCTATNAPYGYGLPGFLSDLPVGHRGQLFVCAEHRAEAERRREAGIEKAKASGVIRPAQDDLFGGVGRPERERKRA